MVRPLAAVVRCNFWQRFKNDCKSSISRRTSSYRSRFSWPIEAHDLRWAKTAVNMPGRQNWCEHCTKPKMNVSHHRLLSNRSPNVSGLERE
uniref:Uncharacterized protein n=1 Tax=Romanomermis culicivorax TaxID=13658 RepID=A0A915JEC3_ROMCU